MTAEDRNVIESAGDAEVFARNAVQCLDHVCSDGPEGDADLLKLADKALADAKRLQVSSSRLAAALRKTLARRAA